MQDEIDALRQARDSAHAFARGARQMAEFLDRASGLLSPEQETEYVTLLERERSTYRSRQEALHALGLRADSIEPADPAA